MQGFLKGVSGLGAGIEVLVDVQVDSSRLETADLMVKRGAERVLVGLKHSNTRGAVRAGMRQLEHLMAIGGIKEAVLYLHYPPADKLELYSRRFMDGVVHLLAPIVVDNKGKRDDGRKWAVTQDCES